MDKEWSDRNKEVQKLIANSKTYKEGINKLIELRADLFKQVKQIFDNYPERALSEMPYLTANGFHNKSIVYSLWHIIRIEDITVHELITKDEQILFQNNSLKKINSPIITTGNELKGLEIKEFSQKLNCKELLNYAKEVMESTNDIIRKLEYKDLKKKYTDYKEKLINSKCVDLSEVWLVDYWCSKNIKGLIQMPFSRHWIMHIEAINRIKSKL